MILDAIQRAGYEPGTGRRAGARLRRSEFYKDGKYTSKAPA
jgi:hypothetical protein